MSHHGARWKRCLGPQKILGRLSAKSSKLPVYTNHLELVEEAGMLNDPNSTRHFFPHLTFGFDAGTHETPINALVPLPSSCDCIIPMKISSSHHDFSDMAAPPRGLHQTPPPLVRRRQRNGQDSASNEQRYLIDSIYGHALRDSWRLGFIECGEWASNTVCCDLAAWL